MRSNKKEADMIKILNLLVIFLLASCGSHPVLPENKDIKVSRETPSDKCKNLGSIEGRSNKINAKADEALEDLKTEAIKRGANFVKIETIGAQAAAVRGVAYFCD